MQATDLLTYIIVPAINLPDMPTNRGIEVQNMMLAIAYQESRARARWQIPNGPAAGLWQFEGGSKAAIGQLMQHSATQYRLSETCRRFHFPFDRAALHQLLRTNDMLAAVLARLLLYSDPRPLPKLHQIEYGWDYYTQNWRPGKPHLASWDEAWAYAKGAFANGNQPEAA